MKILHFKKTNIAGAPDELSRCINKYTNHSSKVLYKVKNGFDVIHFHNTHVPVRNDFKTCIQFHSEPHRVDLNADVDQKLVIAQYHSTLPEYSNCKRVRNIIDYDQGIYKLKTVCDKIRVGFSPSARTNNGYWFNKGYIHTKRILERLKKENPNSFDFDIINGVSLDECIQRKRKCNVIIDECTTPSYHRSGLEGLALGKMTITSMNQEVEDVFLKSAGSDTNPFHDFKLESLYHDLNGIIDRGVEYVLNEGVKSRQWMKKYWDPEDIVKEFIEIYEGL